MGSGSCGAAYFYLSGELTSTAGSEVGVGRSWWSQWKLCGQWQLWSSLLLAASLLLLQKPTDLDQHCLQSQDISRFRRTSLGLILVLRQTQFCPKVKQTWVFLETVYTGAYRHVYSVRCF